MLKVTTTFLPTNLFTGFITKVVINPARYITSGIYAIESSSNTRVSCKYNGM